MNSLMSDIYPGRGFDEQPRRLRVMVIFRCFYLDADNHILQVEIIEAKTLGEAIEKGLAMQRRSRCPAIEIWEGATKVFPVSARPAVAADS